MVGFVVFDTLIFDKVYIHVFYGYRLKGWIDSDRYFFYHQPKTTC